jgi:hypothetical protein
MLRMLRLPLFLSLMVLAWGCAPGDDPTPTDGKGGPDEPVLTKPTPVDGAPAVGVPDGLSERIKTAVKQVRQRDLLTTNSFWTVFHGILGMGPDTVLLNPALNVRVNAIEYICQGGEIRGLQFLKTKHGLDVRTGPAFVGQGHQDQFVAEMAQWGMPIDTPFVVEGQKYTYNDFIKHAEARVSVRASQELSWAILVIGQYRGTNVEWTNEAGETLNFEDVVRYELDQPIDSAACGGTHRLFGLTWVYHLHMQRGGKMTPIWSEVVAKIDENKKRAKKYQNSDGSFSTKYLAGPGNARDPGARIGSSGHVLEWLSLALTDEELRQTWVKEAANALSLMILDGQDQSIESGALYHAAHGLQIYYARVFGAKEIGAEKIKVPLPPEVVTKPKG